MASTPGVSATLFEALAKVGKLWLIFVFCWLLLCCYNLFIFLFAVYFNRHLFAEDAFSIDEFNNNFDM